MSVVRKSIAQFIQKELNGSCNTNGLGKYLLHNKFILRYPKTAYFFAKMTESISHLIYLQLLFEH
jgi:hypothetical protein